MWQITVDLFSGRENPTLVIDGDRSKSLFQSFLQDRSAIGGIADGYQGLGYRGILVEALIDNVATKLELPPKFRVAHTAHAKGLEFADTVFTELVRSNVWNDDFYRLARTELDRFGSREEATEADGAGGAPPGAEAVAEGVTCWIELGAFNPGFWNDPAHIGKNNCYNYASNRRTDTFAQPGRATGHQAATMACADVTNAALSDGLHHRYDCFPDSEKPRWLMAMVVAPGYDYHWYRKQKEGFWGHKPGHTPAKNVDNNGAVVWNPETAARLPYTNFCGYFYACKSQKIN